VNAKETVYAETSTDKKTREEKEKKLAGSKSEKAKLLELRLAEKIKEDKNFYV
jgi:hypothetical protein